MQSITSCLVWSKEYIYFDGKSELKKINLNFFQRVLRVCGFYSNTRLQVIAQIAQYRCFNAINPPSEETNLLLAISLKAYKCGKLSYYTFPQDDAKSFRLQGIVTSSGIAEFILSLKEEKNKVTKVRHSKIVLVSFDRSNSVGGAYDNRKNQGRIGVSSLYEIDKPNLPQEKHPSFLFNEEDSLAKVTYLFLATLIRSHVKQIEILPTETTSGALLARKYGFEGKENSRNSNAMEPSRNLILTAANAKKVYGNKNLPFPTVFLDTIVAKT